MPIYDYKCNKCNKILEKRAKISDITIQCDCGGTMERQLPKNVVLRMATTLDNVKNLPKPTHLSEQEILDA